MNLMEIITDFKRKELHFQIWIRLVWEGHSSCMPNPGENPWPRCLVRSAHAEAKAGTPCRCHLQDLGDPPGSVQFPMCQHCCIRGGPALSLSQNLTCYYGQRRSGWTCNFQSWMSAAALAHRCVHCQYLPVEL